MEMRIYLVDQSDRVAELGLLRIGIEIIEPLRKYAEPVENRRHALAHVVERYQGSVSGPDTDDVSFVEGRELDEIARHDVPNNAVNQALHRDRLGCGLSS